MIFKRISDFFILSLGSGTLKNVLARRRRREVFHIFLIDFSKTWYEYKDTWGSVVKLLKFFQALNMTLKTGGWGVRGGGGGSF